MKIRISVKADLNQCKAVFLVLPVGKHVNGLPMKAMEKLWDERSIKNITTITTEEASYQLEKMKKIYRNRIPAERKFLKVTTKGEIVQFS